MVVGAEKDDFSLSTHETIHYPMKYFNPAIAAGALRSLKLGARPGFSAYAY
jgi:hypothetical protein